MSDCNGDANCPECLKQNKEPHPPADPKTRGAVKAALFHERYGAGPAKFSSYVTGAKPETLALLQKYGLDRAKLRPVERERLQTVADALATARENGVKNTPAMLPPPPPEAQVGEYLVGADARVYRVVRATTPEAPGLVELAPMLPPSREKGPKRPPKGTKPRKRAWKLLPGTDTPGPQGGAPRGS